MEMFEMITSVMPIGNVFTAITTIFILALYWYLNRPKGIPPGPLGLPFVGYLPFIGRKPQETFCKLAKKYGPIFSLYMGNKLVIVLNNYEAIKEAFVNKGDIFSGRPANLSLTLLDSDKYNVAMADGNMWKDHRRFALTVLRDCGVGKLSIEPLIMEEIQYFLSELKKFNGKSIDFSELLTLSVSNNICIPVFGKRFEYDDPWFISAKHYFDEMVTAASSVALFLFFPSIAKIPGISKFLNQEKLLKRFTSFQKSIYVKINSGRKSYIDGQRESYMNAFLGEQKGRKMKTPNDDSFGDHILESNLRGLMAAGTETSANTLMWGIICMMLNPEVQKKVQKEIDEVIGTERTSCWNDRLRTPYTESTICEIQRFATLVPTNVPHRNTEDCEVLGYKIPKNSFILSNLWAVHNDPELWKDPEVFRPERFLSETGEHIRVEYLIPFSLGKRQCLGEILARMELYLYFTSMLQKFTFKGPEGSTPSMEPRIGITYAPKYFKARAIPRNAD